MSFDLVGQAFVDILRPGMILLVIAGGFWGVIAGAIPGVTPSIGMALLLPITFGMEPTAAVVLLAASWSGSEYGGAIPAILINTPGAPANAATTLDGYPLAQQGKAGKAMGISLILGLAGQFVSVIAMAGLLVPLAALVLRFGSPEVFAIALFGLTVVSSLGAQSVTKGLISVLFGLAIATVGFDPFSGVSRFAFGQSELQDGLGLVPVLIGLFAVGEILNRAWEYEPVQDAVEALKAKMELPTWPELRALIPAGLISTIVGIIVGIMPGAGSTASAYVAYGEAKRWSKEPELYGKGSYEGLAASETANNAVIAGDLVPMLAFAVPGSTAAAVFMSGLLIQGIRPGPGLFTQNLDILSMLFVGLLVANPAVLLAGYVLIRPSIYLASRPTPYVLAGILALVVTGTLAASGSVFDVGVVMLFGLVGFAMKRWEFSSAAAVLGLVLGEILESNFRRAMTLASGDMSFFLGRPIALVILVLAAVVLIYPFVANRIKKTSQDSKDATAK